MNNKHLSQFMLVACCGLLMVVDSGCSRKQQVNFTEETIVDIMTQGVVYRSFASFFIENGNVWNPPPDTPVVLIVRDFAKAKTNVLEMAKSKGLKEGKAYLRMGSDKYTYKYIRDVDPSPTNEYIAVSIDKLCQQFRTQGKKECFYKLVFLPERELWEQRKEKNP